MLLRFQQNLMLDVLTNYVLKKKKSVIRLKIKKFKSKQILGPKIWDPLPPKLSQKPMSNFKVKTLSTPPSDRFWLGLFFLLCQGENNVYS